MISILIKKGVLSKEIEIKIYLSFFFFLTWQGGFSVCCLPLININTMCSVLDGSISDNEDTHVRIGHSDKKNVRIGHTHNVKS